MHFKEPVKSYSNSGLWLHPLEASFPNPFMEGSHKPYTQHGAPQGDLLLSGFGEEGLVVQYIWGVGVSLRGDNRWEEGRCPGLAGMEGVKKGSHSSHVLSQDGPPSKDPRGLVHSSHRDRQTQMCTHTCMTPTHAHEHTPTRPPHIQT